MSATSSAPAASKAPDQGAKDTQAASKARTSIIIKVAVIIAVTLAIWFAPAPEGISAQGMHMTAIFVGTILGLILQPLPTPSVALVGLAVAMITTTMSPKEALAGFGNSTIWIIVAAFFIADGFLITGLGKRIALIFVSLLGKSPLGLSYGMAITDLILAPATPSNTARAGGVIYPIIRSLSEVNGSTNESTESRRKLGSFLLMTEAQVNTVTSAMFITAMAGNPLAVKFAQDKGVHLDWGTWALAALVPGLLTLIILPWAMSKFLYPPTVKSTADAPAAAKEELAKLGTMSSNEWIMSGTFVLLLTLWIGGSSWNINATSAAFVGIAILLCTKVLTWKDMAANSSAWSTLIFFAVLVGMADQLKSLKVVDWIGQSAAHSIAGLPWPVAFLILALAYFFVHYFFASNTAQIVALYAVFLGAAIAAGTPAIFAALFLGFLGNLIGGITHYASGPSGVYYGSGYIPTAEWFRVGFFAAMLTLVIWGVSGTAWLALLGYMH